MAVFLALPATTYYIYVSQSIFSHSGNFALTIDGSPSFLTLINPQTDTFIEPLVTDLYYSILPTSKLNIQATFDPDMPITSVGMTFDNPNRFVRRRHHTLCLEISGVISTMLPFQWVRIWPPQHHMDYLDAEVHREFQSQQISR
jgi:hypothetical protein